MSKVYEIRINDAFVNTVEAETLRQAFDEFIEQHPMWSNLKLHSASDAREFVFYPDGDALIQVCFNEVDTVMFTVTFVDTDGQEYKAKVNTPNCHDEYGTRLLASEVFEFLLKRSLSHQEIDSIEIS